MIQEIYLFFMCVELTKKLPDCEKFYLPIIRQWPEMMKDICKIAVLYENSKWSVFWVTSHEFTRATSSHQSFRQQYPLNILCYYVRRMIQAFLKSKKFKSKQTNAEVNIFSSDDEESDNEKTKMVLENSDNDDSNSKNFDINETY